MRKDKSIFKLRKKLYIISTSVYVFLFCLIVLGEFFSINNLIEKESYPNCSEFGVIYLTGNELPLASEMARGFNGIVVIPKFNQIIGDSEYLKCNNYNYREFITE